MWDRIWIPAALIALFAIPIGVGVHLIRRLIRPAEQQFAKQYAGLTLSKKPAPGKVFVRYNTYDGLFIWVITTTHQAFMTPDDARELLQRLRRYNMWHGFFAYGAIIIPYLAWTDCHAQLRSIEEQITAGVLGSTELSPQAGDPMTASIAAAHQAARPSLVFRIAGWLLILIGVAASIGGVINWAAGDAKGRDTLIGGMLFGALGAYLLRNK
jgi:hypothetical protein